MDEVVEQEQQYVDIHPLKKGKRALLFLGDFFIVFLLSLLLFHVGVYPLGRYIAKYDDQITSLHQAQVRRDKLLYDNELLFAKNGENKDYDDFENNLVFTCDEFIHAWTDSSYSQKYNVFAGYFLNIENQPEAYISFYKALDEKTGFFSFENDDVVLKEYYVNEFLPAFDPKDSMSSKGQTDYQTFENKIFVQGYSKLLSILESEDFTRDGISYASEQQIITNVLNNGRTLIVVGSIVTFLLVWIIFHLVIPLFSKRRKTVGMMMLRIERIHKKNFDSLSIPMAYLSSFYSLAAYAFMPMFIPWGSTNFNELFSLPVLFPLALFSLAYLIGSTAFMLFDPFNRSLGDFLCQSYCIQNDDYDLLVQQKGY